MEDAIEIRNEGFSSYGTRRLEIVNGWLKYGYTKGRKFEFVPGYKYKVSYINPARTQHKGAVGIYVGAGRGRHWFSI